MTHIPDNELRTAVKYFKIAGLTDAAISSQLGITVNTLKSHYDLELKHGKNNMKGVIIGALMQKVLEGDITAIIFASKTIVGLKETTQHEFVVPQMIINPPEGEPELPPPIFGETD